MELYEADKHDYKAIKRIYNTAFPDDERAPFRMIKKRALRGRAKMHVARSDGDVIGFTYTVTRGELAYLFYFAVREDVRGKGYGSQMLKAHLDMYADRTVFLAREPLDDGADNSAQRIKRREFYVKNGFNDTPYKIREATVVYDLMSTKADIDPSGYGELMREWAGERLYRRVRMELIK